MTARNRRLLSIVGLLAPAVLLLVVFLLIPSVYLFRLSFKEIGPFFEIIEVQTLSNYKAAFSDDFYLNMLRGSVKLTVIVTVICLVLGYPAAYHMVHARSSVYRTILYAVVVSPLLISVIVRSYGWIVLLAQNGLINGILVRANIVDSPIRFLGSFNSVVIATIHVILPFMILPIASSLQDLDPSLERAALSMGANPIQVFWRVTLPLTLPGVMAGTVLVIALTLGIYITPLLVAGPLQPLLATGIYYVTLREVNFPLGAALSFILLGFTLLVIGLTGRVVKAVSRSTL
jgi:putative spermidine/putrescine transport system permease protein